MKINFKIKAAEFYLSCESQDEIKEALETLYKLQEEKNDDLAIDHVEVWHPFDNATISDLIWYIENLEEAFEEAYKLGVNNQSLK